jgi:hypothetical protein
MKRNDFRSDNEKELDGMLDAAAAYIDRVRNHHGADDALLYVREARRLLDAVITQAEAAESAAA